VVRSPQRSNLQCLISKGKSFRLPIITPWIEANQCRLENLPLRDLLRDFSTNIQTLIRHESRNPGTSNSSTRDTGDHVFLSRTTADQSCIVQSIVPSALSVVGRKDPYCLTMTPLLQSNETTDANLTTNDRVNHHTKGPPTTIRVKSSPRNRYSTT